MKEVWISFSNERPSESGLTRTWDVVPTHDQPGSCIGTISWYGRWRKYCFFPYDRTVFEEDCLRHIADFCEKQTQIHRANGKDQRELRKDKV